MPKSKPTWLERATTTAKYHVAKCSENPKWTLADTSHAMGRSFGSISQDLLIASWLKTHPDIAKIKNYNDVIEFIRLKKRKQSLDVSHLE